MKSAVLHDSSSVYSLRHAPSWMLLAFGAGSVNAAAFLACQRYVTHVTGTATRLGMDAGQWALMLEYGIVVACFVLGAMASVLALDGRVHRGRRPLHAAPLLVVAGLLSLVAALGALGFFGPFGATVEQPSDFALLSLLSFAMGLQNAAVATSTGLAVRTTHMTGPASDLGVHLATLFFATGDAREAALRGAALRAGKLGSFILGGVAALYLTRAVGYLVFLLPAATVLAATASSFVPIPARTPARLPLPAS
jgi:uncharacterized membrane protein YoaK (UPF0700 family)